MKFVLNDTTYIVNSEEDANMLIQEFCNEYDVVSLVTDPYPGLYPNIVKMYLIFDINVDDEGNPHKYFMGDATLYKN